MTARRPPLAVTLGPNSPLHAAKGRAKASLRNASGLALQEELEATTFQWYRTREVAYVYPVGPKVRGYGKTFRYVAPGPFDFLGTLARTGRTLAIELKGITGEVSYKHDPDFLHELTELRHVRDAGGLALLVAIEQREQAMTLFHGPALDALWRGDRLTIVHTDRTTKVRTWVRTPVAGIASCPRTDVANLRRAPAWPILELAKDVGWL